MSLACKIAGHEWDGCTCTRCGEHRDTGKARDHDYVNEPGTCYYTCSKCGKRTTGHEWDPYWGCTCHVCGETRDGENIIHEWYGCVCKLCGKTREHAGEEGHVWSGCTCTRCGATRDKEHDWQGCMCTRCGRIRDAGHDLAGAVPSSRGPEGHGRTCKACGRRVAEPHSFEPMPGCRRRCSECGFEMAWHEFLDGTCVACGVDESDYYCERILSGEVRRYDARDDSGAESDRPHYIDHVKSVSALRRLALADRDGIYAYDRVAFARKLGDIARAGGPDARETNLALRDIVLGVGLGWDAPMVSEWITDPEIASDQALIDKVWEVRKARNEYDNAMIAADSGIGRSG